MTDDKKAKYNKMQVKASGARIRKPHTGKYPLASEERVREIQAYLGEGITFSPVRKRKRTK